MDFVTYGPVDPEMLARILRRERVRKEPPIDWAGLVGQGWRVIARPSDETAADRLREFYRLRKQGFTWGRKNQAIVHVRRADSSRVIYAEVIR